MAEPPPIFQGSMSVKRRRLQRLIGVLTVASALVLLAIAGVALRSIALSHAAATDGARADLAALEDATELQTLLYQKGFVSEYFLTGDHRWIEELERTRPAFEQWLAAMTRTVEDVHFLDASEVGTAALGLRSSRSQRGVRPIARARGLLPAVDQWPRRRPYFEAA